MSAVGRNNVASWLADSDNYFSPESSSGLRPVSGSPSERLLFEQNVPVLEDLTSDIGAKDTSLEDLKCVIKFECRNYKKIKQAVGWCFKYGHDPEDIINAVKELHVDNITFNYVFKAMAETLDHIIEKPDYYSIINLTEDQKKMPSGEEFNKLVNKNYRKASLIYFPDKNPGRKKWAGKMFFELNQAKECLESLNYRNSYDRTGHSKSYRRIAGEYILKQCQNNKELYRSLQSIIQNKFSSSNPNAKNEFYTKDSTNPGDLNECSLEEIEKYFKEEMKNLPEDDGSHFIAILDLKAKAEDIKDIEKFLAVQKIFIQNCKKVKMKYIFLGEILKSTFNKINSSIKDKESQKKAEMKILRTLIMRQLKHIPCLSTKKYILHLAFSNVLKNITYEQKIKICMQLYKYIDSRSRKGDKLAPMIIRELMKSLGWKCWVSLNYKIYFDKLKKFISGGVKKPKEP